MSWPAGSTSGAKRNDLVLYLETFAHTVGRHAAPGRVRCAWLPSAPQDLAADGVVYAEVRFAPELHTEAGLTLDEVLDAVLEGFRHGSAGTGLTIYAICSAMRTQARSLEIAELAVRWRDAGVVGFDIAGAEDGFPPTRHLDAFQYVQRENFHATIHAGEAFGLPSIWEAVQWCGAERLGHGVRIVDDIQEIGGEYRLGRLAAYVRDRRIPLELCPTSNVGTGVVGSIAEHPIGVLQRLRFRVTVNTDNRLMSATSVGEELRQLNLAFGWGWNELRMAVRQRHEERVRPVRRAAPPDQRPHQARLRPAEGRARRGVGQRRLSATHARLDGPDGDGQAGRSARMAAVDEVPMRLAPAATIASAFSAVRIPPLALTPRSGPTVSRMSLTASTVAPPAGW